MSGLDEALGRYAAAAYRYAEGVESGLIPAGSGVVAACRRFLNDLDRDSAPYVFDPSRVEHVCEFIETLPHVKGAWAKRGELIQLEPWQCFALASPFGFVYPEDLVDDESGLVIAEAGTRRFRTALILVPRKNAKTTLAAGVALYMAFRDQEQGAEVFSVATKREQARICFDIARLMVLRGAMPDVVPFKHNLHDNSTASLFQPLNAEASTMDGLNIHAAINDEFAQWKKRDLYGVIDTATGSRLQPLMWNITTASSLLDSLCFEMVGYAKQVNEGVIDDDSFFGLVYAADAEDDWTQESVWRKANPNYGVSVYPMDMRRAAKKAAELPSEQSAFLTKRLNIWTSADEAWMPIRAYLAQGDPTLKLAQFEGERCWLGVDLASKNDLACVAIVFKRDVERKTHYFVFVWHYLPERAVKHGANKALYDGWVRQQALRVTPGSVLDIDQIEADICRPLANEYGLEPAFGAKTLDEQFEIVDVGYDPMHNATQFGKHMDEAGLNAIEVRPTVLNLSEPMKYMEALVVDGTYHHDADPCMAWQVSNVTLKSTNTATDVIFPRKEAYERKIDGVVAALTALNRAMADESNVYEGGLKFV